MLLFNIKYELFLNEIITKFVYYLIIHLTLNSYHKSENAFYICIIFLLLMDLIGYQNYTT